MAEKKKKKTPGGFTTKTKYTPGLRKKGESFMDFTTRQHEQRYPGSQRLAREAGAGGWRYFTPRGAEYRRGIREEMPWLKQGQRYQSADWQRMLANRQATPPGYGESIGVMPPRAPTVGPNYNVLGVNPRRAVSPLQQKAAYMADPRNQAAAAAAQRANIRQTGGDASVAEGMYNSPWAIGQRRDFPPVNYQRPPQYSGPATSSLFNRPQAGPPGQFTQPQLHMSDLARMQQQAAASRRAAEQRMGGGLDFMREYPGTIAGTTRPTRPTQALPLPPNAPFPNLSSRYRPPQWRF